MITCLRLLSPFSPMSFLSVRPFVRIQVDPNAPKRSSKKGNAADIKSKGGLNPIALVVLLIAIAAGVYFSQMKK